MSGTEDAIMMVEGGADLISEETLLKALKFGHDAIKPIVELQKKLAEKCGKEKREFVPEQVDEELTAKVKDLFITKVEESFNILDKKDRENFMDQAREELLAQNNQ